MDTSTISVIGLGYIGLPTAAMFASRGVNVIGVDVNQEAVDIINKGQIHIVEPDLDVVVKSTVESGHFRATTEVESADAFIIAVPTPFKENHQPDLSYIKAAAGSIAKVLKKGDLIILESTSPVGATEKLANWLAELRPDLSIPTKHSDESDINIAHCPERVLPGHVMRELIENDRIVGGITPECANKSVELYKTFVKGECIVTSARTAEMAKLTENSFRDVNIAFANELSMICGELDIDVWELIALANRHPRVNILQPGCGVGGHCIAVDPWFIVDSAPETAKIVKTARLVNDEKPNWAVESIKGAVANENSDTVVCMGIAFKPDIDDLRESPAMSIVKKLCAQGKKVRIVEPNINELPKELAGLDCELVTLQDIERSQSDILALLVAHSDFKAWIKETSYPKTRILDFCGVMSIY